MTTYVSGGQCDGLPLPLTMGTGPRAATDIVVSDGDVDATLTPESNSPEVNELAN